MKDFLLHLKKLIPLSNEEISDLTKIVETNSFKKGEAILNANQINRKLYFINDGLVKVSFFKEDKEYVMKFFYTHEFCAVLDSLTTNQPSNYGIIALSDVNLTAIDFAKLNNLAARHHALQKIISTISSMATNKMMSRIRELLETDARERYLNFLEENGHLMNLINLKDLSAYLGISQVSLSRIRAKI